MRPNRTLLPLLALVLITPTLILLTRSAQQTGDALLYAFAARTGEDLFHPHHLIYAAAVRAIYLGVGRALAAPWWDALAAAQIHGAAWAAIAVVSFHGTASRLLTRPSLAFVGALGLLASQAFWLLSTQASPYVPAAGCLCLVMALLLRPEPPTGGPGRWVAVSLLWALAVLYHQANVLLALPLAAYLAVAGGRSLGRRAAALFLPAAAVVLLAYLAVVIRGPSSPGAGGLLSYALDYALHPNPEWGTFRHLGPAGWRSVLVNHGWSLVALQRGGGAAVAAVVALATLAATLWHLRRVRAGGAWRAARLFLLLWLGTDLAFFLWWLPGHRPFYVLTALPTLLLFLLALDDVARARPGSLASAALPGILAAVVAGVATLHLAVVILPLHRTRRPAHDEARMLDERVPPECRLLVSYEVAQSLRYYHDRRLAAHVRFPLLCLYQGKPVPPGYGVAEGECAVLELAYLRPDQNLSGFDGYAHPAGWLAGLDWLLDLERGPDGEVVSCRDFDLWRGPGGTAYLSIAPLRRPVAGLREILGRLDDLAAQRAGWTDRPFGRWLEGRP